MLNVRSKLQRVSPRSFEGRGSEQSRSRRLHLFVAALPALLVACVASAQYGQPPQYSQPPQYGQPVQYNQPPQFGQYPPYGQYPMLDAAANRVVQKYQNSTCEQIWQQRTQPRSQREDEAVRFLRENPQMRAAFIDRVAAPIANKMFECGMIP